MIWRRWPYEKAQSPGCRRPRPTGVERGGEKRSAGGGVALGALVVSPISLWASMRKIRNYVGNSSRGGRPIDGLTFAKAIPRLTRRPMVLVADARRNVNSTVATATNWLLFGIAPGYFFSAGVLSSGLPGEVGVAAVVGVSGDLKIPRGYSPL